MNTPVTIKSLDSVRRKLDSSKIILIKLKKWLSYKKDKEYLDHALANIKKANEVLEKIKKRSEVKNIF